MGGPEQNKHAHLRRGNWVPMVGKVAVVGLLERHGEGKTSKVRAKVVSRRTKAILQPEVRKNVEAGTTVYTDALKSYKGLDMDYIRQVIDHSESYVQGRVHTNGIENFWSLFKRVVYGTYHSVEPVHLDRYLDENTFKFNTRDLGDDVRFTQTATMTTGRRVTWKELTGKTDMKGAVA